MKIKRKFKFTLSQVKILFRHELLKLRIMAICDHIKNHGGKFDSDNYYCGITNDLSRRENEHHAHFLGFVKVENVNSARCIEIAMEDYGYDTGRKSGNGGQEDTLFVYIYRKIPGVTQEIIS